MGRAGMQKSSELAELGANIFDAQLEVDCNATRKIPPHFLQFPTPTKSPLHEGSMK